jgi:hypothetical protein
MEAFGIDVPIRVSIAGFPFLSCWSVNAEGHRYFFAVRRSDRSWWLDQISRLTGIPPKEKNATDT